MKFIKVLSTITAGALLCTCMASTVLAAETTVPQISTTIDSGTIHRSYVKDFETTITAQNTYTKVHYSVNAWAEDGVIIKCISNGGGNRKVMYKIENSDGIINVVTVPSGGKSSKIKIPKKPFTVYAMYADGSTGTVKTSITLGDYTGL